MTELATASPRSASPGVLSWRRFKANRSALLSAFAIVVAVIGVTLASWWLPYAPNELSDAQFSPPSAKHWLGTDANGRDVFSRVCAGTRVSLLVGLAGAGVSLVIGVLWGAVSGYLGGKTDEVMMRTVDILYALPTIILIIVLMATLQDTIQSTLDRFLGPTRFKSAPLVLLILGLGGISWLTMARLVRAQVRSLRRRPFVEASRALGAGHARLLLKHILPNTTGIIIVYWTLTIPAVVLGESFMSYLGMGIQPPQASLGTLIAEGAGQINSIRSYWWLLAGPGGLLVALLMALSFVGDGLRDAFDPRSRR